MMPCNMSSLPPTIDIDLTAQRLTLLVEGREQLAFPVSTASNGPGEMLNSGCTPRGKLRVRLKIGHDCAVNSVFAGRRATGEIYSTALATAHPDRDWILTRIIWLTGCESGFNRGGQCDTLRRYIYIHGTPDTEPMGEPHSHGCVRMRNTDIVKLFDAVDNGTSVFIHD